MGLFDKVMGKDGGAVTLSKAEAVSAIAVAAIAADGDVSPDELRRTVIDLATLRAFRRHDLRDLESTLNKVAGLLKRRGTGPVILAAKAALTKDEIGAGFFVAADLIFADGTVEPEEKKYLEELQKTLGVDEDLAIKIVEVVAAKNGA